ncbi:ribonuclease P protein component [Xanthobacter aminoxidans]|uniref:ribonuclease P protein component n=1 Tax=Xanthobacter aminoxidans TaxID=186280 RepID=UPI0020230D00|nr:ribonuclease P protein component [Xanthobacter aminoxidans]
MERPSDFNPDRLRRLDRLKKRRDFLAAAKAERAGVASFLMQGRDRGDGAGVRVGFTVTKKTGNSVVRNRIRRRLREAVRQVLPDAGRPGFDYVLVAREASLRTPFDSLVSEMERAVRKLHAPKAPKERAPKDRAFKDTLPKDKARSRPGAPRVLKESLPASKDAARSAGDAGFNTPDLTMPPTETLRHE